MLQFAENKTLFLDSINQFNRKDINFNELYDIFRQTYEDSQNLFRTKFDQVMEPHMVDYINLEEIPDDISGFAKSLKIEGIDFGEKISKIVKTELIGRMNKAFQFLEDKISLIESIDDYFNEEIGINDLYEMFQFRYKHLEHLFKVKVNQVLMMYDRKYIDHHLTPKNVLEFERSLKKFTRPNLIEKMVKMLEFVEVFGDDSGIYERMSTRYIIDKNRNPELNGREVQIFYIIYNDKRNTSAKNKKISNDDIKKEIDIIRHDVENGIVSKYIFINMVELNSHTSSIIKNTSNTADVESFQHENLMVNPIRHVLSPKYRILTKAEKEKHLYDLSRKVEPLTIDDLNGMSYQDPVAKYLGIQIGEIVIVEQNIPVSGVVVQKISYERVITNVDLIINK